MAGRSSYHPHQAMQHAAYRFFAAPAPAEAAPEECVEFTESDVWGCPVEPAPRQAEPRGKPIPFSRPSARGRRGDGQIRGDRPPASLPVNIPDWSKILGNRTGSYNKKSSVYRAEEGDDDDDEELAGGGRMVPPHELLWRSRAASMSVHEGIGRTLKGRDLRRVRNAVWEITGFQD